MAKRLKIPAKLEVKILLKNRHTCCICRDPKAYQNIIIHHIDGNPANNQEENLAVLCLNHASMADAGLKKGILGSGKKLKPREVSGFKKLWEEKNMAETRVERKTSPLKESKQLEILYHFEISKRKNEILSLSEKQQKIRKEHFEFFQQLVIEEFISGLRLRAIIIKAFGDIGVQSAGQDYIAIPLIEAVEGLFLHLVGPSKVKMHLYDKKLLLKSLDIFETVGGYGASISDHKKLLIKTCKAIYELAEVSSWYKYANYTKKAINVLRAIRRDCLDYEPNNRKLNRKMLIKERTKIVDQVLNKVEKLN